MWKRIFPLLLLLSTAPTPARAKAEEWVEIRSPHFTVVTNSNEKTGRRIADQFERMRSVFHVVLPRMSIETSAPVVVLAIKDEKGFRALEPQEYLQKGQLQLGGLFLRAADKNYVLLRLDAEGSHPYSVVYHEYTHLLLSKAEEWLPLWLNEGLAQFFQNTDIHDKDVLMGEPSDESLRLLLQNKPLPLATLFTVDTKSPYYHEENKGSIFYAESWALVHYFEIRDLHEKSRHLADYAELLAAKADPVTAATQTFGDLNRLQANLENYIHQASFSALKLPSPTTIDQSTFQARPLTPAQADAIRADFLAYNNRASDARPLLEQVLKEDPQNVSAHETMGFLQFRAGHVDEARKWYEKAVKLDSQSYLAHYYFAAMSMNDLANPTEDSQVENSLRQAIKLNPSFAPSFERLAAFDAHQHKLEEAQVMALTAVQLDPGNVGYRMTTANILMEMERVTDAVTVLQGALRLAKTPEETTMVENFLSHAQEYATARAQQREQDRRIATEQTVSSGSLEDRTPEPMPKGPHRFVVGKLQGVSCHEPRMELTVASNGKLLALHSGNYFKIEFSALGFTPKDDLDPCKDLEGKTAKVEYINSSETPPVPHVVAIEIHK